MTATRAAVRATVGEGHEPATTERAGRILDAMEAHLSDGGIRAVVMSELAAELSMSTKTLYRSTLE